MSKVVKLVETTFMRELHVGSHIIVLDETDYKELIKIFSEKIGSDAVAFSIWEEENRYKFTVPDVDKPTFERFLTKGELYEKFKER